MTITRPRKGRILEKAGLRYVAAWLPAKIVEDLQPEIEAAEAVVAAELAKAEEGPDQ